MIDLIKDEIRMKYRSRDPLEKYKINCSHFVAEQIFKTFLKSGWPIPVGMTESELAPFINYNKDEKRFASYQIVNFGILEVHATEETGYKISKDGL